MGWLHRRAEAEVAEHATRPGGMPVRSCSVDMEGIVRVTWPVQERVVMHPGDVLTMEFAINVGPGEQGALALRPKSLSLQAEPSTRE